MLSNGAGNINNEETRNNENPVNTNGEFNVVLTIVKVIILAIFIVPLVEYSLRTRDDANQTETDQIQKLTIQNSTQDYIEILTENIDKENAEIIPIREIVLKKQEPTCPRSYMLVILEEICQELIEKGNSCTPEDFSNIEKHKIPKRLLRNISKKETKVPAIVNYAVGIILMASLCAALLELYKAKRHPEVKSGKNSLSRKCSLADLTVMKHQRKEMLRRESIMEIPEENLYSKQLDKRPTPLHRQCSFPVGPSSLPPMGTSTSRRRLSFQANRFIPVVDGRPAAVLEGGRRHSIVSDGRQALILETRRISADGRGMFFDRFALEDSAERRYHGRGRLVHRH